MSAAIAIQTSLARNPSPVGAYEEAGLEIAEMKTALEDMLSSKIFCRAEQMCRLMRFLFEMKIQGKLQELHEYAIGLAVFKRDARSYSTGDDPLVRVQVGRLRERLRQYYAQADLRTGWHFSIPIGSYIPKIEKMTSTQTKILQQNLLAMQPLRCLSNNPEVQDFTAGLTEELCHQLFCEYGEQIVSPFVMLNSEMQEKNPEKISHFLEGSVRSAENDMRLILRLSHARSGSIAWGEVFVVEKNLSIAAQTEMAETICSALKKYFAEGLCDKS